MHPYVCFNVDVADAEGDAEDAAEPDASDDVNAADCKEDAESVTASKDGKEEEGDELKTKLQDEAEPVMPSPAVVMQVSYKPLCYFLRNMLSSVGRYASFAM